MKHHFSCCGWLGITACPRGNVGLTIVCAASGAFSVMLFKFSRIFVSDQLFSCPFLPVWETKAMDVLWGLMSSLCMLILSLRPRPCWLEYDLSHPLHSILYTMQFMFSRASIHQCMITSEFTNLVLERKMTYRILTEEHLEILMNLEWSRLH